MNDWILVSAYTQGDEGAFDVLVGKYFRMVYTLAARQVGDQHLAEEVAQSVFIILARKAGQLSSGVSVCGWLVRTTRFVSQDAIKMRLRRQKNEQEFAASIDSGHPAKTERSGIEALLDEALLALPAVEQAGVMAHFFEGKNFKEVGEMLAIKEDAAQKRVSRSLDKLRAFLTRRGAKVPVTVIAGLLTAQFAREAGAETLQSAIQGAQAAAKGKIAAGKALTLADRAMRLLRWRSAVGLSLKLGLTLLILAGGGWALREWNGSRQAAQAFDPRVEALGKASSRMVLQFASLKQRIATIRPDNPGFQALLAEVNTIGQESNPIREQLQVLLTPPQDRERMAEFLTAEVAETLNLTTAEKLGVLSLVRNRLAQGTTLKDAIKAMAGDIPAIAIQVKALLTPDQRQRFDTIYSRDASGFFTYLRAMAAAQ